MNRWAIMIAAICGILAGSGAAAQIFEVKLGDKVLGSLTYTSTAQGDSLRSVLNNTPFGVFNGTFEASSRPVRTSLDAPTLKYESASKSSRKTRMIASTIADGRVIETIVSPEKERTELSDITRVPHGVVDPVAGIGRLIKAKACPKAFTIYDGRRAIKLSPNGQQQEDNVLSCAIAYQVVAGPGHLSPLYISSVKMQVLYDLSGSTQKLTQIQMGSGLFNLVLRRTN